MMDDKCGNCGFTYGKHYGGSSDCPNPDGRCNGGRRGEFKKATGSEVFYNVWYPERNRWTKAAIKLFDRDGKEYTADQYESDPHSLQRKEAEAYCKYLNSGLHKPKFEVKVIGPDKKPLPLTQGSLAMRLEHFEEGDAHKIREAAFFRKSAASNTCSSCGAPCPCSYHP